MQPPPAPVASDRLAQTRSATTPAARQRQLRDAENFGGEVSRQSLPEMRAPRGLFRLDARLLEDRPPSLDFGLVEGAECLRRLLLARRDFHAKARELRTHYRVG